MSEWLAIWHPQPFTLLDILAVGVMTGLCGHLLVSTWWDMLDARREARRDAAIQQDTACHLARLADRTTGAQSSVPLAGPAEGARASDRSRPSTLRVVRRSEYGSTTSLVSKERIH